MKKRIDIYGTLEVPLVIGCAAFIKEAEGVVIKCFTEEVRRVPSASFIKAAHPITRGNSNVP